MAKNIKKGLSTDSFVRFEGSTGVTQMLNFAIFIKCIKSKAIDRFTLFFLTLKHVRNRTWDIKSFLIAICYFGIIWEIYHILWQETRLACETQVISVKWIGLLFSEISVFHKYHTTCLACAGMWARLCRLQKYTNEYSPEGKCCLESNVWHDTQKYPINWQNVHVWFQNCG